MSRATLHQLESGTVHDADFLGFGKLSTASIKVILDIGANRGQSIASLRAIFPDAVVHAFEANPAFFELLEQLREHDPLRIQVHRHGLGRGRAKLRFYIPWVGETPFLEESSTRLDHFGKPWVVEKFKQRGALRLEETVVDILGGDELDLCPDIIKIDVEGAEHDVLIGLQRTIERFTPTLLVENSDWNNVTPFLQGLGYSPYRWEIGQQKLVPFYGETTNAFYIHPARASTVEITGLPHMGNV
jgi:FkbM family methyltransferase